MMLRNAGLSMLAIASITLSVANAKADEPSAGAGPREVLSGRAALPAAPREVETRWYGWQTLTAVGISDTLFVAGTFVALEGAFAGGFSRPKPHGAETLEYTGYSMVIAGLAGHVLSGPIVHFAHGQHRKGGYSLLVNLGVPLVAGLAGAGIGAAADEPGRGAGIGALGGAVAATILDVAVLSYEPRPSASREEGSRRTPFLAIAPIATPRHVGLGVSGAF